MKRALLTNLSVCTRKLLLSPPRLNPNPSPSLAKLTVPTRSRLSRFYSSESDSSCEARFTHTQKSNGSIEDADELSTQGRVKLKMGFAFCGKMLEKEICFGFC
jgi:small subunit ribosomal protein S35